MAINVAGLVSVIVFYLIILVIGIWAGKKSGRSNTSDELFIANRSMGMVVMVFTLTATFVGGGYINGTAEIIAYSGFLWAQAPIGYVIAFVIAGALFCPKMREGEYVTMFDPFQIRYGKKIGAALFLPQIIGDIFWSAAILAALGATLAIVLDMNATVAIVVSAVIVVIYTFVGGLYSVAYTDVIQLIFIFVGLFLACPFAITNPAVDTTSLQDSWLGTIQAFQVPIYIDVYLMAFFGGIPWQTLYQRSLACDTPRTARWSCLISSVFCLILAIPPMVIGVAGRAADWNQTAYTGVIPIPPEQRSYILPLVLQYLCPLPVSILGLGAVSAAVMSSADSCVLATGTVFAKNIYKDLFRPQASDRELQWALRAAILFSGVVSTLIAITASSVYGLFVLCADLMYVIMFPQLTCVLWLKVSNSYGCLSGYFIAFFLRLLCGEHLIGLPALIRFPGYSSEEGQLFPFRTSIMLLGMAAIVGVSYLTNYLFSKGIIPAHLDLLCAMRRPVTKRRNVETDEPILLTPATGKSVTQ